MDISGKIWHYVARNRNSKSGGWFVKEFNKGGPENQWNTEPIDTSGRVWKYILAFSLQPKESCLHELVAKSSLSAVLRFLASSHKQKCMIEEETNLDEFLGHQLIKPYIPIKPNGSFHEMAQLNHDQLKIVLIFIKKMLQLMTMKDLSTVIPLHYTILGTGGMGKTILINTLTSIFRHIFNPTNAIPVMAFDALHIINPVVYLSSNHLNWAGKTNPVVYLSSNHLNWAGKTIHKMNGHNHQHPMIFCRDIYQLPPLQRMIPIVYLSRNHIYWAKPTIHKKQGLSPNIIQLRRAHAYLRRRCRDDHHATSSIMVPDSSMNQAPMVCLSGNHLNWAGTTIHKMQGLSPKIVRQRRAHAYLRCRYGDDHRAASSIMTLNGHNSFKLTTLIPGYRPEDDHSHQLYNSRQQCNLLLQDDRRHLNLSPRTRNDVAGYLRHYVGDYYDSAEEDFSD
jgi:hypothetical protein